MKIYKIFLYLLVTTISLTSCLPETTSPNVISNSISTGHMGMAADSDYIYFTDPRNHVILRAPLLGGTPTIMAGSGVAGSANGTGIAASFSSPTGITVLGSNLYVTTAKTCEIRVINKTTWAVTTLTTGYCSGITNDGTDLYLTSHYYSNVVDKITTAGVLSSIAGKGQDGASATVGSVDGTGNAARFNYPMGITYHSGKLFISDTGNHTIRLIDIVSKAVTTLAGTAGVPGSNNGVGIGAKFNSPVGIYTNDGITLYVADKGNHSIRKINISSGAVSTMAGSVGANQETTGPLNSSRFESPMGVLLTTYGFFISNEYNIRRAY